MQKNRRVLRRFYHAANVPARYHVRSVSGGGRLFGIVFFFQRRGFAKVRFAVFFGRHFKPLFEHLHKVT